MRRGFFSELFSLDPGGDKKHKERRCVAVYAPSLFMFTNKGWAGLGDDQLPNGEKYRKREKGKAAGLSRPTGGSNWRDSCPFARSVPKAAAMTAKGPGRVIKKMPA